MNALYLCYQSVHEPLTRTQVVAYLEGLARDGHGMVLVTFEPRRQSRAERRRIRTELRGRGVIWYHLRYHKRPTVPATAWDSAMGVLFGLLLIARHRIGLVHARSHVPAMMGMALKWLTSTRLLFDVRGLLAEEYVDAGVWPADGRLFRGTKNMERTLVRAADGLVVLTSRGADLLRSWYPDELKGKPVAVIPCCVDLRGHALAVPTPSSAGRPALVYVGKLGGWYWDEAMIDFFQAVRERMPEARLQIWTQSDADALRRLVEHRGLEASVTIGTTTPDRIPAALAGADVGLSFIHPTPSKVASSPTKIGEYLAAGLPVVTNRGIGDLDELLHGEDGALGITVESNDGYRAAAAELASLLQEPGLHERCRIAAARSLDLAGVGWVRYRAMYQQLADR